MALETDWVWRDERRSREAPGSGFEVLVDVIVGRLGDGKGA